MSLRVVSMILTSVVSLALATIANAQTVAKPSQSIPAAPESSTLLQPTSKLNSYLPSWLQFSAEEKVRAEGFNQQGFRPGQSDGYLLNRVRFNTKLRATKWLKFHLQLQDARVFFKTQKPYMPPFQDRWDFSQVFVELGNTSEGRVSAKVGRQTMSFGEARLLGNPDWNNAGRSYDAARVTLRNGRFHVDIFTLASVTARDSQFNGRALNNNMTGFYAGIERIVPKSTIEPYFFWRRNPLQKQENGATGNLSLGVPGVRWIGQLPRNFDYSFEAAYQRGSLGQDEVEAWGTHIAIGKKLPFLTSLKPRLIVEENYATGDGNRRDGRRTTFDTLLAASHDRYGLSDQVGWKNINHVAAAVEFAPAKKIGAVIRYNDFWLVNPRDSLYNISGSVVASSANGTAGRWVGQEWDGALNYRVNSNVQIGAGYAALIPGTFLKRTTPGKLYQSPYLFYSTSF